MKGQVRLDGPAPEQEKVTIQPRKGGAHSTEGCGLLVKDSHKLQVDSSGGVRNVVVWIELPGEEDRASMEPVLIDQRECVFEPHVTATSWQPVAIRNSDSVIHNIRIFEEGKPSMLMHQWQKADAADILWRFPRPGRYIIRCGVHPWMYSWVIVTPPGRAAVTGSAGRFALNGLPQGRHTLHLWHETLGQKEISVEVGPEGTEMDPILYQLAGGA